MGAGRGGRRKLGFKKPDGSSSANPRCRRPNITGHLAVCGGGGGGGEMTETEKKEIGRASVRERV